MSVSADRKTAAGILLRVEGGAFASRLLGEVSSAGIRTRVMAVLRWRRTLDETLDRCLKHPKLDVEVRTVLRIALVEIVEIGVPPAVAGDAAVRLIRQMGKTRAAGLVNAVIRRAPSSWRKVLEGAPPDLRYSHPRWIWDRWRKRFGEEAATGAMQAAQIPAKLWVWWLEAAQESPTLTGHPWMSGAYTAPGRELIPALQAGQAYAMDPSSQLVAQLAAGISKNGYRVLDLCAAPGGKSARIAGINNTLEIAAADLSLGRLRLGKMLLKKAGVKALVAADSAAPAFRAGAFDLVLLDAPCSGTGTFRRHPELKWRLHPEDVSERAGLQNSLISGALKLLVSGGILLYSTCSVEAEENEAHFSQIPESCEIVSPESLLAESIPWIKTDAGGGRLLPGPEWDGFSFHLLRRK